MVAVQSKTKIVVLDFREIPLLVTSKIPTCIVAAHHPILIYGSERDTPDDMQSEVGLMPSRGSCMRTRLPHCQCGCACPYVLMAMPAEHLPFC
jgi:hypothetical protein